MRFQHWFALAALSTYAATVAPAAATTWLDDPRLPNWNAAGMRLPVAPAVDGPLDSRFTERERPSEGASDDELLATGWRLFAAYQAGWGTRVIQGGASYDGMGRPWGYQAFVFVEGTFAGTLAPEPMFSRSDGAIDRIFLGPDGTIAATFHRYGASDPLCCPSGSSTVEYRIEATENGPRIVPIRVLPGSTTH